MPFNFSSVRDRLLYEISPFRLGSFRKTLVYEPLAPAGQIQAHLKHLSGLDKTAKLRDKLYTAAAIVCGIVAARFSIMATIVPVYWLAAVVFIALAVATSILSRQWSRLDIVDMRCELPQRLIEMLSRDMDERASLDARLDFAMPTIRRKIVSEGAYLRRRGWKEAVYQDPWLRLRGEFLDTTTFELTLIEHVVIRSGTKRSRSGKLKHKRKVKSKGSETLLMLKFPRKKYGAMSLFQSELAKAVSLPHGVALKQIKANDHQLLLRAKAPADAYLSTEDLYQIVIGLFLSAYQALNLAKALSKAAA